MVGAGFPIYFFVFDEGGGGLREILSKYMGVAYKSKHDKYDKKTH